MKTIKLKKVLALVSIASATVAAFCLGGCELVVDFDRTKIDAGFLDTGVVDLGDANQTPPTPDADVPETSIEEAGADADAGDAGDSGIQDAKADG